MTERAKGSERGWRQGKKERSRKPRLGEQQGVCVRDSLDALNGGPGLSAAVQSLVHVQRGQTQSCVAFHLHGKALLENVTHALHKHTHT